MNGTFGDTILTGSLALAVPVAALAGLVSFLSPCVIPLVPGYLGYVTGLSGAELSGGRRARVLLGTSLFVLGFSVVFVSYGLLFGGLGSLFLEHGDTITRVLGVVTIGLGLLFAGWLPGLSRDWRTEFRPAVGLAGAPLLGAVFGIGWTPCMGPTLAAVQVLAFDEASAGRGALLSFVYCLGLGLPFLAAAVAYQRTSAVLRWVRRHQLAVMRTGGVLLIALGVLLVTGAWGELMASMQGWIGGFEVAV
ncbi:cytochrome c-type biogenesis protein [Haloactinopolyspora alba]|uniref:Cytochrome c-type biogenesis protein n=1 Tax=Haloactinopolyspora alba TaxID=648780 RepID=A0A2P8DGN7_9ACTN|nr:cytochrome c biogenesis protein CcdA [Haloactinopolyspora alba]PSK96383.1 cytochrome c-type biogenesis protein [Haloactinopolyspora alba]